MTQTPADPVRRCARCGEALLPDSRYCTACGLSTSTSSTAADREGGRTAPGVLGRHGPDPEEETSARLVECPSCGAGNAASRPLCARCGTPLRDEVPGGDALPDHAQPAEPEPPFGPRRGFDTSPVLLALVLLAGLVTAGVLLALVTSQVTREPTPAVPTGVTPLSAAASSSLQEHPAGLAIDGDPATAWTESVPGDGREEYLEVRLADPVEVRRVLIWNGDQGSEEDFERNGRAAVVRIEVGERQFRVELLDIRGPQGVDLPSTVADDRVRLVIERTYEGERYTDLAISEVVIEAAPDEE